MSRLEFNFKEIEKEPFMFEVMDRRRRSSPKHGRSRLSCCTQGHNIEMKSWQ